MRKKSYLIFIGLIGCGLVAGWYGRIAFVRTFNGPDNASNNQSIVRENGNYTYISPLLFCGYSENKEFDEFKPFKDKISAFINEKIAEHPEVHVSVYYRAMDKGHWFGINPDEQYSPASLLKVPLMIANLKFLQEHADILNKRFQYVGGTDYNALEHFQPAVHVEVGKTYSFQQLLEDMIVYSDNNAAIVLNQNLPTNSLDEVYSDLGLHIGKNNDAKTDFMSAKVYSYFFRALYNASYLNRSLSEYALGLLSKARFANGIAGGIPKNVAVAEKFGERSIQDDKGQNQLNELHDCAIIYYPNYPYMLCIMTKGANFDTLSEIIKGVSSTLYDEVDVTYKNKPPV